MTVKMDDVLIKLIKCVVAEGIVPSATYKASIIGSQYVYNEELSASCCYRKPPRSVRSNSCIILQRTICIRLISIIRCIEFLSTLI